MIFFGTATCCDTRVIETQIGPFNLGSMPITESTIVSQYGQGCVKVSESGTEAIAGKHVYYVKDEKVWVEILFSHVMDNNLEHVVEAILVTKQKLCEEKHQTKRPFVPLVTSKEVKIGDPIDKIIKVYGKPSISIDLSKDKLFSVLVEDLKLKEGQVIRYLTDHPNELFFAEFYFKENRLHSILISASE